MSRRASASLNVVVPAHRLASGTGRLAYLVFENGIHAEDSGLYQVTNGNCRKRRQKHGQGSDFQFCIDRVNVRLARPIRIFK
jgi:hypothetical protein